jgi:hypothetical protein
MLKKMMNTNFLIVVCVALMAASSCTYQGSRNAGESKEKSESFSEGTYGFDRDFLMEHNLETIELFEEEEGARLLIAPGLQGRVITSTANGLHGLSYGWINYDFIAKGEPNSQFNPFGGEERFWLGPEGGPFSIYFDEGKEQVFANWRVPKELDTEPFEVTAINPGSVSFQKSCSFTNASGFSLSVGIDRSVKILSRNEAEHVLQVGIDPELDFVAFETRNEIRNSGNSEWNETEGFLSVWLLSMLNPSEKGVVFIPFKTGAERDLGKVVKDDYFGKVPAERLIVKDGVVFFKTDGKYRSKIGISPQRALPSCGSYDETNRILTLMVYSLPAQPARYVNSQWGVQDDPLKGDVVNSYNDGPADDGTIMGPFYELESSSPAALLKPGEKLSHTQQVFHISGDEDLLSAITMRLFNLSLDDIKGVF